LSLSTIQSSPRSTLESSKKFSRVTSAS
jgi:hypothetical protein